MRKSLLVVVVSAVMAAVGIVRADVVRWDFPRLGCCHEGLAFGDGVTGVLVCGGGDEIRLTVGRADLWDHRGGYPWTPEQSYTNVVVKVPGKTLKRGTLDPFTGLGSLEFAEGGGAVGIALSDGTRVSGKRIDGHVSVNVAR